jgi:sugar/nucleoside kinase (ribokinase family)
MVEFFRDGIAEIIGNRVNLIFCNEDEALGWAQSTSIDVAVEKLKEVADCFVITLGADGALTYDGKELVAVESQPVKAVDTNGAGDMFAGAFLYAITRGESFPTAGRFASLAAGKIVANFGPRLPADDHSALRAEFFSE